MSGNHVYLLKMPLLERMPLTSGQSGNDLTEIYTSFPTVFMTWLKFTPHFPQYLWPDWNLHLISHSIYDLTEIYTSFPTVFMTWLKFTPHFPQYLWPDWNLHLISHSIYDLTEIYTSFPTVFMTWLKFTPHFPQYFSSLILVKQLLSCHKCLSINNHLHNCPYKI